MARNDMTTVWVDRYTKDQIRAAAALLGITTGELLDRLTRGDGPPQGIALLDWARSVAAQNRPTS